MVIDLIMQKQDKTVHVSGDTICILMKLSCRVSSPQFNIRSVQRIAYWRRFSGNKFFNLWFSFHLSLFFFQLKERQFVQGQTLRSSQQVWYYVEELSFPGNLSFIPNLACFSSSFFQWWWIYLYFNRLHVSLSLLLLLLM